MKRDSPFHPYAQGPKGENVGSITQPLPSNYLIFRAASESDGESCFGLEVYILVFLMNYFTSRINWMRSFLSLQGGAGWMPWSWLSAAPVSTSWQPKAGKREISAHLQSPPIYSTCCRLPHSLMQSCYSKYHTLNTAANSESVSHIIYLLLTFISCCYWMIYVSCNHTPSCCACQFMHKTVGNSTKHIYAVLFMQSEIPRW